MPQGRRKPRKPLWGCIHGASLRMHTRCMWGDWATTHLQAPLDQSRAMAQTQISEETKIENNGNCSHSLLFERNASFWSDLQLKFSIPVGEAENCLIFFFNFHWRIKCIEKGSFICTVGWIFTYCPSFCNQHPDQEKEYSYFNRIPGTPLMPFPQLVPQEQTIILTLNIQINFALYIIESHSFMDSFTQYYIFKIHPYICLSLWIFHSHCCMVSHCVNIKLHLSLSLLLGVQTKRRHRRGYKLFWWVYKLGPPTAHAHSHSIPRCGCNINKCLQCVPHKACSRMTPAAIHGEMPVGSGHLQ